MMPLNRVYERRMKRKQWNIRMIKQQDSFYTRELANYL